MHIRSHGWAALAAAAVLAACGGGREAEEEATAVPASASAAPDVFTRYAADLPADERREPLSVDGLTPPTSESTEPEPIAR